jgi:hypothetical protein
MVSKLKLKLKFTSKKEALRFFVASSFFDPSIFVSFVLYWLMFIIFF